MKNHSCSIPVLRDKEKLMSHSCRQPHGGKMTIKPPKYVLKVSNPPQN